MLWFLCLNILCRPCEPGPHVSSGRGRLFCNKACTHALHVHIHCVVSNCLLLQTSTHMWDNLLRVVCQLFLRTSIVFHSCDTWSHDTWGQRALWIICNTAYISENRSVLEKLACATPLNGFPGNFCSETWAKSDLKYPFLDGKLPTFCTLDWTTWRKFKVISSN